MNRSIQKKTKMGYGLFVNLTGTKGAAAWERVGFLFNSSVEAAEYRSAHYPQISHKQWKVQSIRVSAGTLSDKDAMAESNTIVEKRAS